MYSNYTQDELDNHSNQLNTNNDAYWNARGYDERPEAWDDDMDDLGNPVDDYYDNCDYEDWCSDDFDD